MLRTLQFFHQLSCVVPPSIVPSPVIVTFLTLSPHIIAANESTGLPSHDERLYSDFSSYDSIIPGRIANFSLSVKANNVAPLASSSVRSSFKNILDILYVPSGTSTLVFFLDAIIAHCMALVSSCFPSPYAPKSLTLRVTNS